MPLNPQLHNRLRQLFGRVILANPGAGFRSASRLDPVTGRMRMEIHDPGEYYRVSCPYCRDQRQRLWINHCFGNFADGRRMLHLAICYNEDCLSDYEKRRDLFDRIYGLQNMRNRAVEWTILQPPVERAELVTTSLPGTCIPLHELDPHHPAVQYMVQRYPMEMLIRFGCSFCVQAPPQYRPAQGRVIIPIYMNGILVGWQGRWPADLNWKHSGIPKYYTMPGLPKRELLYNWDTARQYPFIVVHEGITDVWASGPWSVALLGKTMSLGQQLLLTVGRRQPVVLMLDGGEEEEAVMRRMVTQLTTHVAHHIPVLIVRLPNGRDPGSYDSQALLNVIHAQARAVRLVLPDLTAPSPGPAPAQPPVATAPL